MDLDKLIEDISSQITNKFERDFYDVSNEVNELYFKEANKIYESFITQYYASYRTSFYIRHWEGVPGTRHGSNLLYGNQNKIHRGMSPYFEINYNGTDMADDYQHNSADQVLMQVAVGIRGVPPYWSQLWHGTYNSRYFHYTGSLMDAYDYFLANYEEIMYPVFMRRWKKLGWI